MDFNPLDKLRFNCLIALPKWILMTYRAKQGPPLQAKTSLTTVP